MSLKKRQRRMSLKKHQGPKDRDIEKMPPDVNESAFKTVQAALGEAETPPPGKRTKKQRRKAERRGADRRVASVPVAADRRIAGDRRERTDRRRDTPVVYSRDEAAGIRKMVLQDQRQLVCPRCGGSLTLGASVKRAEGSVREVRCSTCHRSVMFRGVP